MASISTVSTLLPPQHHSAPAQTSISAANPPPDIAPVSSSSSSGDSVASEDNGANTGRKSQDDTRAWIKIIDTAPSNASAKSVVDAKAEAASQKQADENVREATKETGNVVLSDFKYNASEPDRGSESLQTTLPKAEGPLPIPTADILLKFKNSRPT
ncbi:hypothetical protein SAMN04488040_2507 [Sulfitobacter marinus]|uniref:Uncharacterized protein n=1 Tax=Sulfitobacter marinus TaxID=394264 RepID=A0A1I6U4X1_9RHOB|nr:hypothetical protein [Sulfitobacter marinus]SFS96472.1 hypothetical protein SAMN04488040_2507 [Sulfitobacter marinus]